MERNECVHRVAPTGAHPITRWIRFSRANRYTRYVHHTTRFQRFARGRTNNFGCSLLYHRPAAQQQHANLKMIYIQFKQLDVVDWGGLPQRSFLVTYMHESSGGVCKLTRHDGKKPSILQKNTVIPIAYALGVVKCSAGMRTNRLSRFGGMTKLRRKTYSICVLETMWLQEKNKWKL